MRSHEGKVILKGQCAPAGNTVIISGVLPSSSPVPPDGSKYSVSATDGNTSATEYFSVIAPLSIQTQHGVEIAYLEKHAFRDTLILPSRADCVSVKISLGDGSWPAGMLPINIPDHSHKVGDAYVYSFDYSKTQQGQGTAPPGVVNTRPDSTLGFGTVIWEYTLEDSVETDQALHPFYTINAHSMMFINAIRKMVDKARIGDVNEYLAYTMSDLAHALLRGCDYVMQSPPVAGGWALNQIPVSLRDYIVKAGALDVLRAQYQAEGMSAFDLQGMRTQLQVDRTQVLVGLIDQLNADMEKLPQAKNEWLAQGAPLGNQLAGGKRPIGTLALTRGTYSPWPMVPMPIVTGGYSFIGGGLGFGPLY